MAAAMGTITVSDRFCSMEKMPPFQSCGVLPTSDAISPTLVLTVLNRPDRLPMIPSIRIPLIHSPIKSPIMWGHLLSRALPDQRGRGGFSNTHGVIPAARTAAEQGSCRSGQHHLRRQAA